MVTKQLPGVAATFAAVFAAVFLAVYVADHPPHRPAKPQPPALGGPMQQHHKPHNHNNWDPDTKQALGHHYSNGLIVTWQPRPGAFGASPLDAMQAAATRLEHLQGTPQATPQNAKALFSLLEAIDALAGTHDVTAEVGPGFQQPPPKKEDDNGKTDR